MEYFIQVLYILLWPAAIIVSYRLIIVSPEKMGLVRINQTQDFNKNTNL